MTAFRFSSAFLSLSLLSSNARFITVEDDIAPQVLEKGFSRGDAVIEGGRIMK